MGEPAAEAILALLAERGQAKSICPSEVARNLTVGGPNWRHRMPEVHAAVDALLREGHVMLSWKGERLARRIGPYRIVRRTA